MIPIRVEMTFSPTLSKKEQVLLNLPNKLATMKEFVIDEVAPATQRMLARHWDTKGSAYGHKWAPWAPSTMLDRLRKGNAEQGLLRDTEDLFRSIFRDRKRFVRRLKSGARFVLDTGVRYAVFNQVGTSFMPERQVIPDPLPKVFLAEVRKLFREWLRK